MNAAKTNKLTTDFEAAMLELEEIVQQIENDEIKLEAALDQYQRGAVLVKFCQDKLSEVEQKIKILDNDSDNLKDFAL